MEAAAKNDAEKKTNSGASQQKDKTADPVMLDKLLEMGMGKRLAKKSLVCTENKSLDAALAWIAELGAEEMEALCESSDNESADSDEWEDFDEEDEVCYKMVFVVNTELNMGVGKVASQVGHAALGLYRLLMEDKDKFEASLEEWEEFGEKKNHSQSQKFQGTDRASEESRNSPPSDVPGTRCREDADSNGIHNSVGNFR